MKRFLFALILAAAPLRAAEEGVSADPLPVSDGESLAEEPSPLPSGFSGDVRLRVRDTGASSPSFLQADPSLRRRPYFYQRSRVRWEGRVESGLLAVRPVPGPSLAWDDLRRRGVVKGYVSLPGRAVAGDYRLSFGQGLLFYDQPGEFVRPAWAQGRGAVPDLSSTPDQHLRGGALRWRRGGAEADVFYSRLLLDVPLGPDGAAAKDLWSLREGGGLEDEEDVAARDTTEERLAGARLQWGGSRARAALTAARVRYGPSIEPEPEPFSDGRRFRGRRLDLWGADGAVLGDGWRIAWDGALSVDERRRGTGWAATFLREEGGVAAWASFFVYDGDFFSRQGKGPAFETADMPASLPNNQRGLSFGVRRRNAWGRWEADAAWARFPAAQGNGSNADPVLPSQARRWRWEGAVTLAPRWELSSTLSERVRERSAAPAGGLRRQGEETVRKWRLESAWKASPRLRLRSRYDVRWERDPFTGRRAEGKLLMEEAAWAGGAWGAAVRWYAFHSPEAFLTTGVETIWDGVVAPRLAAGMGTLRGGTGERVALTVHRRWGERLKTWAKYDTTRRWSGLDADVRHAWHFQGDFSW